MLDHLDALEAESIFILREAYRRVQPLGMLWSLGKDSNTLIWLAKKAFLGRVPFPVIHLDTGLEFDETYAFREWATRHWGLDLIADACPPLEAVDPSLPPASRLAGRKSLGLTQAIERHHFRGLILGIRRDEQATRAKERVFSPRGGDGQWDVSHQPPELWDLYSTDYPQDTHLRIHPILGWTEIDIWRYTEREGIPVVPLYFAKDGQRYRSLGEKGITLPIKSQATTIPEIIAELEATKAPERAGRVMDHDSEHAFERLRLNGYM